MEKENRSQENMMIIPPGETIKEAISYNGISIETFAEAIGLPLDTTRKMVDGQISITEASRCKKYPNLYCRLYDTAKKMEELSLAPASFWISLDLNYLTELEALAMGFHHDRIVFEHAGFYTPIDNAIRRGNSEHTVLEIKGLKRADKCHATLHRFFDDDGIMCSTIYVGNEEVFTSTRDNEDLMVNYWNNVGYKAWT